MTGPARRMTPLSNALSLCLCILWILVAVTQGTFQDPAPKEPLRTVAEEETVLLCRYQPAEDVVVVQVTWFKEKAVGSKEQMITAHHRNGQTTFGSWSQRVRFRSSEPTVDSSLVIMNTEVSDQGDYICHISTFPSGNFDRELSLVVWTIPISSLDPVILVEGQSYRQAAYCRSVALPPPQLSWDTDLNGRSTNRSVDDRTVTSQYSLHPLRSMNGKKLDCLVWHPTQSTPRRLSNTLVVHFPPHAEISGYKKDWYMGMENAALRCESGGNPKPSFTWIRVDGELPEGVIPQPDGTLLFGRPLSMSDRGTYKCVAKNQVGSEKDQVEVEVTESLKVTLTENMVMIIVGSVAGGLLILMLIIVICVTCHHKSKNKKLTRELTEKKEEISTLSRQASFRRMNSISTDTRGATEENIPLRVEGMMRTSMSSLGEQAHCRDSRSTISGSRCGGGGGGAFDYLGRPVLHNNSARRGRERPLDRDEESRLRVETYVRNSTLSLQESRFHPPLQPTSFPVVQSTEIVRQRNGIAIIPPDGGSRPGSVTKTHQPPSLGCNYPPVTDDEDEVDEGLGGPASQEHPDDQDSETNSSHVSEAHSAPYQHTNGTIRPKPRPSPTMISPHASLIHKAQIV